MERLLDLAAAVSDQAEIYHLDKDETSVTIQNSELDEIETTIQTGFSLRLIKDGKLGSSYTKNLVDRDGLVANALRSLGGGVYGEFEFPGPSAFSPIDPYV